jgi:hypothetical protein
MPKNEVIMKLNLSIYLSIPVAPTWRIGHRETLRFSSVS